MGFRTYWSLGLTPAQSWIAEARRSRDLRAGSRILAWIMGRLLLFLQERRATVRLPQVTKADLDDLDGLLAKALGGGSGGVSNYAGGWVELPLAEAEGLFHELQAHFDSLWNELRLEIIQEAGRSAKDLWQVAGPEIGEPSCPLQFVWALQETSSEDRKGLEEVDALFAAVKRSRPIPSHAGFPVRKCGQCGRREAIGGKEPIGWRQFQEKLAKIGEVQQGLRIDADEYLCSICGLRRFAGYLTKDAFPSTSEIAAAEWLWRIRNAPDLGTALTALQKAAAGVPGYDQKWADRAPLYYRRSLDRELRGARKKDESTQKKLEEVQVALGQLEAEISKHNRRDPDRTVPDKPPQYLAVLMFDGDEMGRKLREDLDSLPRQVIEFQKRVDAYFGDSGDETAGPRGKPFYLGGDEGLILAPVAGVLDTAHEIWKIWGGTAGSTPAKATLSMGIALFDRERPLGAAIETARRSLEERAKRMKNKNALAISVQTASGSAWTAAAHWGESWDRITAAVELIRRKTLSSGWPHDVERFLRTLSDDAFKAGEDTRSAIRAEVKRITARRCTHKKDRGAVWTKLNGENWWRRQPDPEELATLPDHLHLVAFVARQAGAL